MSHKLVCRYYLYKCHVFFYKVIDDGQYSLLTNLRYSRVHQFCVENGAVFICCLKMLIRNYSIINWTINFYSVVIFASLKSLVFLWAFVNSKRLFVLLYHSRFY